MASAHSCFFPLAARPLSAARTGCLTFLVALLWLCGALPAHALRSPSRPLDRVEIIPTSPVETRAGDFYFTALGHLSLDLESDPMNTPGCAACAYETASGRRKWLNQDPLGEAGGINLYRFVYNSPLNYVDPDGLTGWALNNPARWGNPSAPDLNPNYPGPTAQDLEVAGTVASIFLEPLDWAMTGKEIYDDPTNPWSYAGIVPFVPSAAGKAGKKICKEASQQLSQEAKRRLAKELGDIPRSAQPTKQGRFGQGTKWWEYTDSHGNRKIVVEHPDGTVHIGTPKPQSTHHTGGPPKYYPQPGTGHVGE